MWKVSEWFDPLVSNWRLYAKEKAATSARVSHSQCRWEPGIVRLLMGQSSYNSVTLATLCKPDERPGKECGNYPKNLHFMRPVTCTRFFDEGR
jgi:hypothetical protein